MDNFDLRKFLTENKLTKNSKLLKEDFAPSPNSDVPNANAEEYDVATAFKKAKVDMSRPVTVIHMYGSTPSEGSDEDQMSAEAAVKQLESERQQNRSNYTDGGREVPSDIHGYEFENYTVLEDDMPEGHEYKLSYTNMSGEDTYVIVQEKSEGDLTAENQERDEETEPDFRQEAARFPELVDKHGKVKVVNALEALYDNARDAVEAGKATSVEDAYENSLEMLKQDPEGFEDLMAENQERDEQYYEDQEQEEIVMRLAKEAVNLIYEQPGTQAHTALQSVLENYVDRMNEAEGGLNERVGGLQEFISLIKDRANDFDGDEVGAAEEVIEALGDHYGIRVDIIHSRH